MDNSRLLNGIRVLDFSAFVAGLMCGQLLADLGAEVIKIESPSGGDPYRTFMKRDGLGNIRFDGINSEKKSVTINLKNEEGVRALKTLAVTTDILLTNTRLQCLEKRGLDHKTLCRENPRLIYAWISGNGENGPEANLPAYDSSSFWAKSGLLIDMMSYTETSYPATNPVAMGDRITGLAMFSLVMAALLRREKTGKSDHVITSLYHAGLFANAYNIVSHQDGYTMPRARGKVAPECAVYICADGKWILLAIMSYPKQGRALWNALGFEELYEKPEYSYPTEYIPRFSEITKVMDAIFITKASEEWGKELSKRDISYCILANSGTAIENEQGWANRYFERYVASTGKEYIIQSSLINMESQPRPVIYNVPLVLGADTEKILGEIGFHDEELKKASQ